MASLFGPDIPDIKERSKCITLDKKGKYYRCAYKLSKADASEYIELFHKFKVATEAGGVSCSGKVKAGEWRQAYLWHHEDESKAHPIDTMDKKFIESKGEGLLCHKLYGLHTYGGYYMFFRPDAEEVANLIATVLSLDDLAGIERLYVTTEQDPPNARGTDVYDNEADRHQALTTVYVLPKVVPPPVGPAVAPVVPSAPATSSSGPTTPCLCNCHQR